MEFKKLKYDPAFSVDFFKSVITKRHSFSFLTKKLPLEALGMTGITGITSGQFCQNGRLGPPESEAGSDPSQLFSRKAEI